MRFYSRSADVLSGVPPTYGPQRFDKTRRVGVSASTSTALESDVLASVRHTFRLD